MNDVALRALAGCLAFCIAACTADAGTTEPVAESKQALDGIIIEPCFTFDPTLTASQASQNAVTFSGQGFERWLCRMPMGDDSVTVYLWNETQGSPASNEPPQVLTVTSGGWGADGSWQGPEGPIGNITGFFYIPCEPQTYSISAYDNTVGAWQNEGIGVMVQTVNTCDIPK